MYSQERESKSDLAAVYGSPGTRVRFLGFFSIFWPFIICVFAAGWLLRALLPEYPKISQTIAGVLLILLVLGVWRAFYSACKRFESFLKGANGEEIVARELSLLPAGWSVFHGVVRPKLDFSGDFDHIVLGPDMVFVIETKNWDGRVSITDGKFFVDGMAVKNSPIAQVRKEAAELSTILKNVMPADLKILPLICFAGDSYEEEERRVDDVVICNARSLRSIIFESSANPIDEKHRSLIIETLLKHV